MPERPSTVDSETWMLDTRALWIWARHGLYEDDGSCFRCGHLWPCADRVDAEEMLRELGLYAQVAGITEGEA